MSEHPRFPDGMSAEAQLVVADEVDITLAGFPSKRPLEIAITAYAEDLAGFLPEDIRAGFRAARRVPSDYAPTPPRVRDAIGAACIARRAREAPPREDPEPALADIPPELRKSWRDALGGEPPKPQPVLFVDGKPQEPTATPIAAVVEKLGAQEAAP